MNTTEIGAQVSLVNPRWSARIGTVFAIDDFEREGNDVRIYVRWNDTRTVQSFAPNELETK